VFEFKGEKCTEAILISELRCRLINI
jgi:hypothetical protein